MTITPQQAKIMDALFDGPKSWTQLRLAYYGEYRAKSPASTSFNNQLQRMMDKGMIKKVMGGYDTAEEHGCFRCNTCISVRDTYCEGCKEDRRAAGRMA